MKKLRAIRQQNYVEKKRIQQRMVLYKPDPPAQQPNNETRVVVGHQPSLEERRRKIAALKVYLPNNYHNGWVAAIYILLPLAIKPT